MTSPPTATEILLQRLVDYAGLFPPASLDMRSAVTNYDAYLHSQHSKMLGRFIVPAARLTEMETALPPAAHPELSVIAGSGIAADFAKLDNRHTRYDIKSIEVKAATAEDIHRLSTTVPAGMETYVEIPFSGDMQKNIEAIAKHGFRAKIRTGGEAADRIPACADIANFLHLCAHNGIMFKATAGLHHPCRSIHPLTYQPDSPSGMMHGFLNVFLAAAFIHSRMDTKTATELLQEQSAKAFHFNADGVIWRARQLDNNALARARKNFAVSFGSCSFTEPVDDLAHLGLL